MHVNLYQKQVVFNFYGKIIKPLDVGDEVVTIQLLLTCGRVITEIK